MASGTCTLSSCSFICNCNIIFSVFISFINNIHHNPHNITTLQLHLPLHPPSIEILPSSPKAHKPSQQSFLKINTTSRLSSRPTASTFLFLILLINSNKRMHEHKDWFDLLRNVDTNDFLTTKVVNLLHLIKTTWWENNYSVNKNLSNLFLNQYRSYFKSILTLGGNIYLNPG